MRGVRPAGVASRRCPPQFGGHRRQFGVRPGPGVVDQIRARGHRRPRATSARQVSTLISRSGIALADGRHERHHPPGSPRRIHLVPWTGLHPADIDQIGALATARSTAASAAASVNVAPRS